MDYQAICSKCGKSFNINESHNNKSNKYIHCPHCDHMMCIPMVAYCPTCRTNMAFRTRFFNDMAKGGISFVKALPDIANLTGKRGSIFKGFLNDAKNAYKGLSGQMPRTNQFGYCCRCNKPSVQCPSCNSITHLSESPHQGQIIVCSSCQKQMVFI